MRVADILWVETKDAAQDTHAEELSSPKCEWEGLASDRSHACLLSQTGWTVSTLRNPEPHGQIIINSKNQNKKCF